MRRLLVTTGPDQGRVFTLTEGESFLLGRSRATETRLIDPHVSRVHCQVQIDKQCVVLNDFESAGGTYVNGQRVNRHLLQPGDKIRIGKTEISYLDDAADEASTINEVVQPYPTANPVQSLHHLTGTIFYHYLLGPILAQARSGTIFHARDTKRDLPVALKVMFPIFSKSEQQKQRFVRAMKTMLPLRHPNIVCLYGAGKKGPYCWIAMEYVEGENLTQIIQRIGITGMLDWRPALRWAIHIGRALDYASQQQIVHRNITPMNILVRAHNKQAVLGDLMLAKAMEGAMAQQVTRPGELIGDLLYMSPERTHASAIVDARSDVYSLGATTYALLTGRPPFESDSLPDILAKIRTSPSAKPKKYQLSIPQTFEDTVLKMLAKRPDDRFQTAGDLLSQLQQIAKSENVVI